MRTKTSRAQTRSIPGKTPLEEAYELIFNSQSDEQILGTVSAHRARTSKPDVTFDEIEQEAEKLKVRYGQSLIEAKLQTLLPEPVQAPCPQCGRTIKVRDKNRPRSVRCLSGS